MRRSASIQQQPSSGNHAGFPKWWQRILRYGILLLAIVFFVIFAFIFLRDGQVSDWENVYVRAALKLQAGEPIHRVGGNYTYPPAMAMLAVPIAILSPRLSLFCWYLVNVAAAVITFSYAWRLAGGPRLTNIPRNWQAVFVLATVLTGRFFVAPLENRQFDMVIAALLLYGCYRLWQGHYMAGAIWLGLSASMKGVPMLFVPYLLWRKQPVAAAVVILVAALLNVAPDFIWPQTNGHSYLGDWLSILLSLSRAAPGQFFTDILLNQSLSGLFHRFFTIGFPVSTEQLTFRPSVLSPDVVYLLRALTYGSSVLLVVFTAWRFGRPGVLHTIRNADNSLPIPIDTLRTPIEFAGILCLMLLLSPMSSKSHYVVVLFPVLILARLAVERPSLWISGIVVILLITGPLTAKGLIGKRLGDLTLAWGFPTVFALISWLGVLLVLASICDAVPGSHGDSESQPGCR